MQAGGWALHRSMFKYIERVRAGQSGAAQLAVRQNRLRSDTPKPILSITISGVPSPATISELLAAIAPLADVEALNYRQDNVAIKPKGGRQRKQMGRSSRQRKTKA